MAADLTDPISRSGVAGARVRLPEPPMGLRQSRSPKKGIMTRPRRGIGAACQPHRSTAHHRIVPHHTVPQPHRHSFTTNPLSLRFHSVPPPPHLQALPHHHQHSTTELRCSSTSLLTTTASSTHFYITRKYHSITPAHLHSTDSLQPHLHTSLRHRLTTTA